MLALNEKYVRYKETFEENELDGETLIHMYNEEKDGGDRIHKQLKDIGIKILAHKLAIANEIKKIVENNQTKYESPSV